MTPVPQGIVDAVDAYVRRELSHCARYSNRAPLDESGVWSLRRLVEQAYAMGYDAGHSSFAEWHERVVLLAAWREVRL